MKYRIDVQPNHYSPATPVFQSDDVALAHRVFVAMTEVHAVVRLVFERSNGAGDVPVATYTEPNPFPEGVSDTLPVMEVAQ